MVHLKGGTYFLVLSDDDNGLTNGAVHCHSSFQGLVGQSYNRHRISPIFPLDNAPPPSFENLTQSKLIFFGPIYPGNLDLALADDIQFYLTLGTYNFCAWIKEDNELASKELTSFLEDKRIPYEVWELSQGEIDNVYFEIPDITSPLPLDPITTSQELKISAREYSLLINKAINIANIYWKDQESDLALFDEGFRAIISKEPDDLGRLTNFVVTNAALSRFISQAYSGCSPIEQTECSYATNSLLGIGLANQALISIQRFSSHVFYNSRIIQRIKLLKLLNSEDKSLYSLEYDNDNFNVDHLHNEMIEDELLERKQHDIVPNISCFSGRDGFRATKFSLSAPLEIISGSNTYEWTLMTLTHEISHIVIEGVLGAFFSEPRSLTATTKLSSLMKSNSPQNMYEQAEQLLVFGLAMLYREHRIGFDEKATSEGDTELDVSPEIISKYITEGSPEANETLTHIFDYLYFYRAKDDLYIKSVWSSWAVVPNIELRIPLYITRSLCALASSRKTWNKETIISEMERLLTALIDNKKSKPDILKEALAELKSNNSKYSALLEARVPFIKFAKAFLYSPTISKKLVSETIPAASSLGFRRDRITNPLRFLEEHAKEQRPDMLKSLWILQHIAFCNSHDR